MNNNSVEYNFLKSALTLDNPFLSTENFMEWLEEKKANVNHKVTPIKFSEMSNWRFNDATGNLEHDSGKFFSIEGIEVKTNWGNVAEWSQPIINQPEIGFLGIITKKIDGVLYFLMKLKLNLEILMLFSCHQRYKLLKVITHKCIRVIHRFIWSTLSKIEKMLQCC